jgi:hypothetical protein
MGKRLPPSRVKIKGVVYIPESPDAAVRRKAEREERVYIRKVSKVVAMGVARGGAAKTKAQRDPALHHHVMVLRGALNSFAFEGSIVLPPKRIETREGKGEMVVFVVGRTPVPLDEQGRARRRKRFHKTLIYANAYGDLAVDIIARYCWKDHIRVWGVITSHLAWGRPIMSLAVQRVELVARHPDNAHLDDAAASVADKLVASSSSSSLPSSASPSRSSRSPSPSLLDESTILDQVLAARA